MTHRVYVRCSDQKVTHKTTTESASVAAFAFEQLEHMAKLGHVENLGSDAVGITWSEDGKQMRYLDLTLVASLPASAEKKGGCQP